MAVLFLGAACYAAAFWRYAGLRRRAAVLGEYLSLVRYLAVAVRDRCLPFALALRQYPGRERLATVLGVAVTPRNLAAHVGELSLSAESRAAASAFFQTAQTGSRISVAAAAERLSAALDAELAPLAARLPSELRLTLLLPLFGSAMLLLFLL